MTTRTGNGNRVLYWIMGSLFAVVMFLVGVTADSISSKIDTVKQDTVDVADDCERRIDRNEEDIEALQRQEAIIETRLEVIQEDVDEMKSDIKTLLRYARNGNRDTS